nr:MAG TPA: chromosome segregation protein [Caudoviricetes sp.]
MTDYTISCKLSNETVYACYRGRFWRWDGSIWKESHLMTQKFERAKAADKKLTPQAFLTNGAEFAPLDEYELPEQMLTALREAKPCKNAPIEPVEEHPTPSAQCSDAATAAENQTAASPAAPEGSSPTTELATAADAPGVPVSADENAPVPSSTAPTFDFGADDQTNALLLQDAQTFITGNMARIMAAKHAHDLTANHYQGSWGKWCAAVGISRDTGDRMVSVAAQCGNIQLEGKSILDVQPLKLLYAAAKPSTPEVVKQAVFTGDITTYKEYQELMAQLKAEKDRADAAEKSAQNARKENAYFKELVKSAEAQTHKDAEKREEAESRYESALADISGLKEQNAQLQQSYHDADESRIAANLQRQKAEAERDKAEARAKDAENQLSGSRQVAEAAKLRADKLQEENAALKKQPIAAVVDEEEVDRRAKALAHQWDEEELDRLAAEKAWGLADARNSELAKDNTALRKQLATLQARANDNTQADFETANYCASLFRSAWDTCKGSYSRLTGEDLESTFQTLCGALNSIMEEASLLCRQPADYDGGAADEPDV